MPNTKGLNIKIGLNTTVTLADKEWILAHVKLWKLRGEGAVVSKMIEHEREREKNAV